MLIYINSSFDFLDLDNVILKITSRMHSSDGSFFKPFITLAVHALSDMKHSSRHGFSGGGGGGGAGGCALPPKLFAPPPEAFGTAPKSFCAPANYIYFDLIVSYLIILTTKFVKLPILCLRSRHAGLKQILLNFFLGLSGRCHHAPAKASCSTPPDIYPPPRTKI